MNKEKASKITRIVIRLSFIVSLALIVGFLVLTNRNIEQSINVEYIQKKANSKINKYKHAKLVLDSEYTGEQDIPNVCEYVLTSTKDGVYHSYSYRDEESDMYQCWEGHDGHYHIYIYDKTMEKWVSDTLDYEPVTSDTWSVVSDLSKYTILDEPGQWGDDECWVLQVLGDNEYWEVIYEELYIRKSDFMPIGIVTYANTEKDKDRISDIKPGEYEFGTLTEGTAEESEYDEMVSIYSIEFSNESLDLFGIPEEFITMEEYNELIRTEGSEINVETDN